MNHKIYVASSWRNHYQPGVVKALRNDGHEVYDFKNPPDRSGFAWSQIDPNWEKWTTEEYQRALLHPLAEAGYQSDYGAMRWASAGVLVLPCGKSAHLEAGWFTGAEKPLLVYIPEGVTMEPELMYLLAGKHPIVTSIGHLLDRLSEV